MDELHFTANNNTSGFRLQYLEVLNWGTFNKNIWRIEPDGFNSLLTGDIGSGKSTLVDAVTCLLVPHQRIIFNKAAGAEGKERNLLSYVKGEYKKEKQEITNIAKKIYLRPDDNTYSVIVGNFYNAGYEECVCLAQVFWIKDNKVEKLLVSSSHPLNIKQHFTQFNDFNELRKRLRNMQGVNLFDDNFTRYSENFRHRFGMTSDKAIDLFYQTVSMKSVSSLTEFVREQMLERTDVKEQVAILLKRFDDLNKAHSAVATAREQYQILKPLVESSVEYGNTEREIAAIEEMLTMLPVWFSMQKKGLIVDAITGTEQDLRMARGALALIRDELKDLETKQFGIMQDIENNGGRRLEQIREEVERREQSKTSKRNEWDSYDKLAKQCGLTSAENETAFIDNSTKAQKQIDICKTKESELRLLRDQNMIDLRRTKNELKEEEEELLSLKKRETQIPAWLISLRKQICEDLRIQETDIPFAGELLKTREDEKEWEGAIERLLHDFGISLLVPRQHYRSVSQYINGRTLRSDGVGRKLGYLEANVDHKDSYLKQLTGDSLVHKLEIKPDSDFYTWMENYLHRNYGDCACVDIEELHHIPYGITRQGLIKTGKIRHIKDDRRHILDRKNYVLGWTNAEKIRALEETIVDLRDSIRNIERQVASIERQETENNQLKQAASILLLKIDFSSINWYSEIDKINELQREEKELLENNDLLKLLRAKLEAVKADITYTKDKEGEKNQAIGKLIEKIESYESSLQNCDEIINAASDSLKEKHFPSIEEKQTERNFKLTTIDSKQEQFRKLFEGETGELKKLRTKLTKAGNTILERMRDIKEHSKAEYSELSTSLDTRGEYIDKFNRLVNEDLKRHEERFKEELNRNTINSIAVFDSQLEKHEKDIKSKIQQINKHLREIIYDSAKGTYITILMDQGTDNRIRQFREDLKQCYMHSLSGADDLYKEEKYEQVKKILDRFASAEPIDKDWTNTVTDVRQWFDFNASERYGATNEEKEFYEGSGGKSGGQKEKLAYTILASALAYQFGLQFGEVRSRSFRFVVIDEAFGRGSDESTRYGLELFKKLNLQLLIVTPLQKIHIIENHVNSFHFVSNKDGNNSQVSNFSAQEYVEEKIKRNNVFKETIADA